MKSLLLLLLMLLLAPTYAWAQRVDQLPSPMASGDTSDRIAAVVNDGVITTMDIKDRMTLAMLSSGLPSTPEIEQRLLPQVLRGLIDEQLQLQEAKRLDVSVSKEEIDKALERIAHDNNIPTDMRSFVQARGGSATALEQQVRAGMAWSKVVQRELRPRVEVGDDEVDAMIDRLRVNAGKNEYSVSEIFLSVENPKDDEQVKQAAENLAQQLKGGANFGAVARQFSQSTGASSGGDIGWIQEGQLPTELNQALVKMQPDEVAGPIRTTNGYHIMKLREKRTISLSGEDTSKEITLDLKQAFHSAVTAADQDKLQAEAGHLRTDITDCNKLQALLPQKYPAWKVQNLGTVKTDKIPAWLSDKIHDLSVNKSSEPISTDKGTLIVFVCGRHVPEANVDRTALMNTIGTEKLELQVRRQMRDLRRAAYIDVRLGKGA